MKIFIKYTVIIFIGLLYCCKVDDTSIDRFAHIEDKHARDIIKMSIAHAGGIEKWESMKGLRYTKDFSLLLGDGSVEKSFSQVHEYEYDPLNIDIKSKENDELIHTQMISGNYSRKKDGEVLEIETESLVKAINTSTYVIGMPFKLLDPGVEIVYEGELFLENEKLVDVIKATYNPTKSSNHSTADVWKYYFDKSDRKIVGNWVQTGDHANIIENLTYERVGGILFNKRRKSFRLDSLGKKEFVRADYYYDKYEVKF